MKNIFILFIIFLIILYFVSCSINNNFVNNDNIDSDKKYIENVYILPQMPSENSIKTFFNKSLEELKIYLILNSLSLEEKAGQVFISGFYFNENEEIIQNVDSFVKNNINRYNPGGIILSAYNIKSIIQLRRFISDLQLESRIPMFIAIDQEGGSVQTLSDNKEIHATKIPAANVIGKAGDMELTYEIGKIIGEELASVGINMDLAPVADILTNPLNPVIGARAFGSDPFLVAELVAQMVKGIQSQNISAVCKHFPGHGDTKGDSHNDSVIVQFNLNRLMEVEFIPFIKSIEADVDCIMIGHIQLPEITGSNIPATFSSIILKDILREKLKFNKIIITDSLEMGAISNNYTMEEAVINAFLAGADLILVNLTENIFNSFLDAVKNGIISKKRLDESVLRILKVKLNRNILNPENDENMPDPELILGNPEHLEIIQKVLDAAL